MNLLNLLRHISLKHVRFQKARTIMAASGICLGVAAVVSIGIVNKSVLRSFEESINHATGRASLQITGPASGFPEAFLDTVRAVQGVEYAVPVIEAQGIMVGAREPALMILGVDVLLDHQIRDYKLSDESADIPDPLMFLARADSLLLTKRAADREGIALEQTVKVQTVQGILPFRVRGLLNPEGPARAMGGNVAVMDLFAAQKVFGKEGWLDRIDVSLAHGADLDRVKSGIEAAIPAGYRVDTPEGRTKQVEVLLATFQKNINLTSFITMFVGMYLIYNAVSISVVQRGKEIGILRAIGATRQEIVRLLLGETLVTALAASALGVGFGILLAKAAIGAIGKIVSEMYLQTSVTEITLSWTHPALGIAIGVAASLVAALFPVLSSTRISPISAIRSVPYLEKGIISVGMLRIASGLCLMLAAVLLALYKTSEPVSVLHSSPLMFGAILLVLLGVSLATPDALRWFLSFFRRAVARRLGPAGMLAGLNLQKNVTRNSVAAAAIFYGIAIFVSTSGFMESARVSVLDFIDSVVRADILVTSGHPLATSGSQNIPMPVEMEKEIVRIPGVLSADPFRKIYIDYGGRRVQLETVDVARRMAYSPFIIAGGTRSDMLRLMPNQDTVSVNEGFAARYGLKPGDVVTLPTSAGPVQFGVAAVFVDFGFDSGIVLLDIHTYQRHWGEYLADMFSVRVKPGHDVYDRVDEVRKKSLNRKTEATMVLFDKGGGKRTRSLMEYSKRTGDEAYKVLVLFKTPPDLKDVGFLIHARTFADRDLWAYFPEFKRIRRIPTSSQDDSFFGSDFSYDDFGGPAELNDYSFKILREETVDNLPAYVIEVTPKIRRKYTRYVAWVAKDLWIHVRIEYYQDKEIYRVGSFGEIKIIDGIPTPFRFVMENKKTNHRTEFTLETIQYNVQLTDDFFTQRSLERAGK